MLKKEARRLYQKKRASVTHSEKIKWDDLLLIQFQTLKLPFLSSVMSYYPIEERNEVNTFIITDYLHFKNPSLQIAYPRTDLAHEIMQAVACTVDTIFEDNEYNIPEPLHGEVMNPAKLDMILVPLLAFDSLGNRIGYGKGYYDRFLAQCNEDCLKIGLSYFDPLDRIDDTHKLDIPLNICITPKQVYVF